MMKRLFALIPVLLFCLTMLPTTALAAGNDRPHSLYVGNTNFASTIYPDNAAYWTSSDGGTNWTSQLEKPTGDSYIHYNGQGTLTLHNANIQGQYDSSNRYSGYGIYAVGAPGNAVSLTIKLEGTNTVSGWSGIFVHAVDGAASLSISGTGSLATEGTGGISFSGIVVQGNGGKAELTINNVDVTATNTSDSAQGILLQSADSSPATLTVNGGELTASGQRAGIKYVFGSSGTGDGTPGLTVTGNAVVDAKDGGMTNDSSTAISIGAGSGENGGIVWNGRDGTVYGKVELQEDLEIGEGESLTIGQDASLNTGNHEVIVNGGTLIGGDKITGTVKYAPVITTESLPGGTVGTAYSQALAADGTAPISWSVSSGALPAGLTLSSDGQITGTPTTAGTSTFTVTATNASGSASKAFTITVNYQPTTITTQPQNVAVTVGQPAAFTVAATGSNLAYQWQQSTDGGKTWTDITGATGENYTTAATTMNMNGCQYRCVVKGNGGEAISNAATLTVNPVPVTGVTLDKNTLALFTGESATLTATVAPENATDKTVTWTSDNEKVATVADGKVTAIASGTANITVTTTDGSFAATCAVTVTQPVTGVTLDKKTLSLFTGDSATLTATVAPENATDKTVTWVSSNPAIVTVDGSGHVKAVAAGTANITVTTTDGNKTAACAVTVTGRTYTLSSAPSAIAFGNVYTGYNPPSAQVVVVKNTGNQSLNLTQPTATNFGVGKLSQTALKPGETATFIVQPKAGLGAGSYKETLTISGDGGAKATVNLSFVVQASPAATATPAPTPLEMHTLHFDTNGGLPMDDVKFGLGAPVELWPYTPVRAGYLFQGWYSDQALTKAVGTIVLVKDTTIYAKWAPDPAAAASSSSGSGSGSGSSGSGGNKGGTTITVTPAPTATATPTPTPTVTPTPEPTATPEATLPPEETDKGSFPVVPVAAGAIILLVLVGGIVIFRRFRD